MYDEPWDDDDGYDCGPPPAIPILIYMENEYEKANTARANENVKSWLSKICVLCWRMDCHSILGRRILFGPGKIWHTFVALGFCLLEQVKFGPFSKSNIAMVFRELLLGLDYLNQEGKIHHFRLMLAKTSY